MTKNKIKIRNNNKGIIVIAIILSTITFMLGVWQYKRLLWKEGMIENYQRAQSLPAVNVENLNKDNIENFKEQKIFIKGYFPDNIRNHVKYVGPRTLNGANNQKQRDSGYYVFVPFVLQKGKDLVAINLGWIRGANPRDWPKHGYTEDQLDGLIANNNKKIYSLEVVPTNISMSKSRFIPDNDEKSKVWLYFDTDMFFDKYRNKKDNSIIKSMYLHLITKEKIVPGITTNPYKREFTNKHLGYMLTWFGLAFLLLLFAFLSLRKRKGQQ